MFYYAHYAYHVSMCALWTNHCIQRFLSPHNFLESVQTYHAIANALFFTFSIWIENLSTFVVLVAIDTATLFNRHTFISAQNVARITGTAFRAVVFTFGGSPQVAAGGRTSLCTQLIVAM